MKSWVYILGGLVGLVLGTAVSVCLHLLTVRKINKAKTTADVMTVSGLRLLVCAALFLVLFLLRNVLPINFYAAIIGAAIGLTATSVILSAMLMRRTARQEEHNRHQGDKDE